MESTLEISPNGTVAAGSEQAVLVIDRLALEVLVVPIVGTTPLIINRFTEKAKRQMLDNMQGRKLQKEPKDPQADYEAAFYRLPDGAYGCPSEAFWQATISAARFYRGATMTALRQYIQPFRGESGTDGKMLVRIDGEPRMREDVVRVGRGTDLRYRPEFSEWRTALIVPFVSSAITRASVLSLIDAGGVGVGVCEWRPEKNGPFGTYRIDPDREVEVLR